MTAPYDWMVEQFCDVISTLKTPVGFRSLVQKKHVSFLNSKVSCQLHLREIPLPHNCHTLLITDENFMCSALKTKSRNLHIAQWFCPRVSLAMLHNPIIDIAQLKI